jgi:hypothetical protein
MWVVSEKFKLNLLQYLLTCCLVIAPEWRKQTRAKTDACFKLANLIQTTCLNKIDFDDKLIHNICNINREGKK